MFSSSLIKRVANQAIRVNRSTRQTAALVSTVSNFNRSLQTSTTSSSSSSSSIHRGWLSAALAGTLVASYYTLSDASSSGVSADAPQSGLNPKQFVPFKLAKRLKYNHNTDLFIFDLQDPNASLDLPVASFVLTRFKGEDGKDVIRPYTPVAQNEKGQLSLLVKNYPNGVMSKHIHSMQLGDVLDIKGPMPKFKYQPNKWKEVGMIAGGTGITPMMQVMEEILRNPDDHTKISLVFANTSQQDILLKHSLNAMCRRHGDRLKVTYVIDKPEPGFTGVTGYINSDLIKPFMPKPTEENMVFVCGPPGFMTVTSGPKTPDFKQGEVSGALKQLGFNEKNVFKF